MSARVNPAVWKQTIEKQGFTEAAVGQLMEDPFLLLASRALSSGASGSVSIGVSNGADYGQIKVHVQITVPVYPSEADIGLAGEAAFIKAHKMVNEASAALGLDPLH